MNYALLDETNIVINIIWLNYSNADDFPNAVQIDDRPVTMGDVYKDGKFYRDGAEVLTPLEAAFAEIEKLKSENVDMQSALEILEVTPDE